MNRTAPSRALQVASRRSVPAVVLAIAGLTPLLTGCRVVGDIFKAGIWVGVIFCVGLVMIVAGLFMAFTKKRT
jgi:hypothetical protein